VTFGPAETKFFKLTVPEFAGSISVTVGNTTKRQSEFTWWARREGTPSAMANDFTVMGATLTVPSPRAGVWYFALKSEFVSSAFLKLTTVICKNNTIGPNCDTHFEIAEIKLYQMNILTPVRHVFHYWKVVVNHTHPLWASVRTVAGAPNLNNVQIYASKGQIPTLQSADLQNCYFQYCDGARIILLNATNAMQNETWFVGFTTDAVNVTYSVWFDSACAQECTASNTGTCTDTDKPPGYGVCVCVTSSLTGVDCTDHIGLGPEYIVLIIIAALVVASAVIGFVAWAYMRRKRVQYETVT
jgi:hypothetical protein